MNYPKFKIFFDDIPLTPWERFLTGLMYVLIVMFVIVMFMGQVACSTARRVVCPEAKVVKVVATEHSYLVTYVAECREHTEEISK